MTSKLARSTLTSPGWIRVNFRDKSSFRKLYILFHPIFPTFSCIACNKNDFLIFVKRKHFVFAKMFLKYFLGNFWKILLNFSKKNQNSIDFDAQFFLFHERVPCSWMSLQFAESASALAPLFCPCFTDPDLYPELVPFSQILIQILSCIIILIRCQVFKVLYI